MAKITPMSREQFRVFGLTGHRMDHRQAVNHLKCLETLRRNRYTAPPLNQTHSIANSHAQSHNTSPRSIPPSSMHRIPATVSRCLTDFGILDDGHHQEPDTAEIRSDIDAVCAQTMAPLRNWLTAHSKKIVASTTAVLAIVLVATALTGCGGGDDDTIDSTEVVAPCEQVPTNFVGPLNCRTGV